MIQNLKSPLKRLHALEYARPIRGERANAHHRHTCAQPVKATAPRQATERTSDESSGFRAGGELGRPRLRETESSASTARALYESGG